MVARVCFTLDTHEVGIERKRFFVSANKWTKAFTLPTSCAKHTRQKSVPCRIKIQSQHWLFRPKYEARPQHRRERRDVPT